MKVDISKKKISSYVGDILPLHIGFDGEYHSELKKADIKWSSDSDAVDIKGFSGDGELNFNNGILLILRKAGEAKITACYNGTQYVCDVSVRERLTVNEDTPLNYYLGDMHNHSTQIHDGAQLIREAKDIQKNFILCVEEDGGLDACALSDHAGVINDTDFYRGFVENEKVENGDGYKTIIFPGAESEVGYVIYDRFGIKRRKSGEMVTLNSAAYLDTKDWKCFEDTIKISPDPFCTFAHPTCVGISTNGVWDFDFKNRNTPEMLRMFRGIEMGTGNYAHGVLTYEYAYSDALDAGFRLSPTGSADRHVPVWGKNGCFSKTIIMAPEKSREAFVDAFRNNRFYATETGNVKLSYSVNGKRAPADLDLTNTYKFHVEVSLFEDIKKDMPIICQVISDYGKKVKTIKDTDLSSFDFEIESDTARYFYLRLIDKEGKKTWSCPVFCGREYDQKVERELEAIDMSDFSVIDLDSNTAATIVLSGTPMEIWEGSSSHATLLIDMKKKTEFSALGFCQRFVNRIRRSVDPTWNEERYISTFATEYAIHISDDGVDFKKAADGVFRAFGGEEIVDFGKVSARYMRIELPETTGSASMRDRYDEDKISVGNITLFK